MHDLLVVGVPLLAILSGILFSNSRLERLEFRLDARMDKMESHTNSRFDRMESQTDSRFSRIEARLDRMQADLSQFYAITARHELHLEAIEKRA